jgi:hypothetical protein
LNYTRKTRRAKRSRRVRPVAGVDRSAKTDIIFVKPVRDFFLRRASLFAGFSVFSSSSAKKLGAPTLQKPIRRKRIVTRTFSPNNAAPEPLETDVSTRSLGSR